MEAVRPQIERAYERKHVKVEMAKLQVAMMSVLETEVRQKDGEIGHLQHDLQQVQVRVYTAAFYVNIATLTNILLQAVVEAKNTQLQQKEAQLQQKDTQLQQKDDQIQQQGTELRERTLQLNRQQREVQTLRVRKWMFYCVER